MTQFYRILSASAAAVALLVTGCAVGPDFKRPEAPAVNGYTDEALPKQTASANTPAGAVQTFAGIQEVPADWWKLYGSEPLNALVNEALRNNPDITAAKASLKQAQENFYAEEGVLFPSVTAGVSTTRERFSPAAFGQTGALSSIFTLYNASVNVSYGLDLFGGTRREIEAYEAQTENQRFALEAAYLSLTANVVTAAVQEASLREQIKQTQSILELERKQLKVAQQQFELGAIAKSVELSQETVVAQTEATLPAIEKQLAIAHNGLMALTGHFPAEKSPDPIDLAAFHLPETLPQTLPSKLVEQRPDIRQSEALMHAASAEVGVATANQLPQITLSGAFGNEGDQFRRLFSSGTQVWNVGGGVLQPIFNGGQLWHEKKAATAAYEKAQAQYRSTVLLAFGNVANTLRALQFDADALAANANAEAAAQNSYTLAEAQFKDGAISYPQLLDAERALSQTRIALVQSEAVRLADTAALFQALGGGWWNRTDTAPLPHPKI